MLTKVLDELEAIAGGISTTSGTADFVISSAVPFLRSILPTGSPLTSALVSGKTYQYHARYKDGTTAGYEWGRCTWNGTNTLSRDSVTYSSNANAKVSWSGADVQIVVSESVEMMTYFMARTVRKGPGAPYFIAGTGQSNINHHMHNGDWASWTDTAPTYISDWSVANLVTSSPQGYDATTAQFRAVDHTEGYTNDTHDAPAFSIGYMRSHIGSPEYSRGHPLIACAHMIHHLTGSHVYTLNVAYSGVGISNPLYGWLYDDSVTGSVATTFATEMGEALTALSSEGITAPDLIVWMQGETDINTPTDVALYANYLTDFVKNAENPNRWGYADPEVTQWLICTLPGEHWQEQDRTWIGPQLAAAALPHNVHVFDASNLPVDESDEVHYSGAQANAIGRKWGEWLVGARKFKQPSVPFQYLPDYLTTVGVVWDPLVVHDTNNPTTNGDVIQNNAHTQIKFFYSDFNGTDVRDYLLRVGEDNIPNGFFLTDLFDATKYVYYVVSGPGTDNGTYITFSVSGYDVGSGGEPTAAIRTILVFDNGIRQNTATAATSLPVKSSAYAVGNASTDTFLHSRGKAFFDLNGAFDRLDTWGESEHRAQTTGVSALTLAELKGLGDGEWVSVKAEVTALTNTSPVNTAEWTLRGTGQRTGSAFAFTRAIATTTHYDDITGITITMDSNASGEPRVKATRAAGGDTVYTVRLQWQKITIS